MHPDKLSQAQIETEVDVAKKMLAMGYEFILFTESDKVPLYSKTIQGICDLCRNALKEEKPFIMHIHSFLTMYGPFETSEHIK